VRAIPHLTIDPAGCVYVVYEDGDRRGVQDILLSTFDRRLRPSIRRTRVNPPDRGAPSDQFLTATTTDPATGWLWICFYDTAGDPSRRRATYSCTASADGGHSFAAPARAATAPSDETAPRASPLEYGEYAGVIADHGRAYPVWTDSWHLRTLTDHITHGETKSAVEQMYQATSIAPEDVAEVIAFAVSRPRSVSLNEILVRPTGQAQ
jgi:hypothetical protein